MNTGRSSIFDDDIDVSDFKPKPATKLKDPADRAALREVAAKRGFASREPEPSTPPPAAVAQRVQRRHTTGRNRQLNIKASAETIERFYALADAKGWVLGETFEQAVAALEAKLGPPKRQGQNRPA